MQGDKQSGLWLLVIILNIISQPASAYRTISAWKPIFRGIEHASGQTDIPRLQKVNVIKIDLRDPNISFIATPSNGSAPGETNRRTGSQFMADQGVQVGINTHFYSTSEDINWNADLCGLAISQGNIVSPLSNSYPNGRTLLITSNKEARFEKTGTTSDVSGYWIGVESMPYILHANKIYTYGDTSIHPRSVVGLSADTRYLFLMTIDGRQTGYSEGATLFEEAQWLIDFWIYYGLNLDGGGSTHMLISDGSGGSIPVSSPSEDRAVGSHLGVYAASLPQEFKMTYVYADFEDGKKAYFNYVPGGSGGRFPIDRLGPWEWDY